ncbi:DNA repair protein RecN [Peptoniphilus equinus]|uniref:DNA repair protein RecN n=1 Tax=Peptoniphilus equinus TaxID=3016343 RepID=A0ABY7QUZ6_9FIRM|nr:DNA repair protein RecN [Peptoniphilus equinus]WBW50597.1 DNA repair protein RecN [Peptoniphilus equinus]
MLLELYIKNFAIIQDVRIEFGKGLNILTGETGTGKSIIIDALSVVLGGRANKDMIRKGEEFAYIEAIFTCYESFEEMDMEFQPGELIILSKEIKRDRPALSRVNGRTVNNGIIETLTGRLIDIFAQHESMSLMQSGNQRELLDSFAGRDHLKALDEFAADYSKLRELQKELDNQTQDLSSREREMDLLSYQLDEIDNAKLSPYDDEELERDFKRLNHVKELAENLGRVMGQLKQFDGPSVESAMDDIVGTLSKMVRVDEGLQPLYTEGEELRDGLKRLSFELEDYFDHLEADPQRLRELEDRLDLVNSLKKKYGNTLEAIDAFYAETKKRLDDLVNYDTYRRTLETQIQTAATDLKKRAESISERRKVQARVLETNVAEELHQLVIRDAQFKVDFKDTELRETGADEITFLIKTNRGEDFKPLAKTASGGEMSRIMLGFKSILAQKDNIQTLIFDEIDTGISGATADVVGRKIKNLARERQVIVISHLQQIVAYADHHYLIEKKTTDQSTISTVIKLNEDERLHELARLIGGETITPRALEAARELILKGASNG